MLKPHTVPWWGDFHLKPHQALQWRIGPSILTACRTETEWRFHHAQNGHGEEDGAELAIAVPAVLDAARTRRRILLHRTAPRLTLTPRPADRPVVAQPHSGFTIPPRLQVSVFITTPLWVQLSVEGVAGPVLDLPLWRPSDTWFGASTREGELCYSISTRARSRIEERSTRPHQAVTPVLIHNDTSEPLIIDRLSLPTPHLALYADRGAELWTQAVRLRSRPGQPTADLELGSGAPEQAVDPEPVSGPRCGDGQALVVRAWSSLFKREA